MPPIISIVGKSSTGKTTFLEKLIREISNRGYKVATIKHSHHAISFDQPNKDSWRHAQSGAVATMVSSTTEFQLIKPIDKELTIEELAMNLGEDYDIILSEGFSRGSAPKIEIHRKEAGPLLENVSNLFAVVTDEPLDTQAKQFSLEDVQGVATLLEEIYLKPTRERIALYIDGKKIPLSDQDRPIIIEALLGLSAILQKSSKVKNLELRYHANE